MNVFLLVMLSEAKHLANSENEIPREVYVQRSEGLAMTLYRRYCEERSDEAISIRAKAASVMFASYCKSLSKSSIALKTNGYTFCWSSQVNIQSFLSGWPVLAQPFVF